LLNGREISTYGTLPLGIVPDAEYDQAEIALARGDYLALYTDGLLEARRPGGELFGFARLQELFVAQPTAAEAAHAALIFGQDDDITVLTLTRVDAAERPLADSVAVAETA
jgi:serine phosphatase RsbU (regulator of sigma subunit)